MASTLWRADRDLCNFQLQLANRRGEHHFHSTLWEGVGRKYQRNPRERSDPNYTPIVLFKPKTVLHISSWEENIPIFVERWRRSLALRLGCPEEETKEKKKKKTSRGEGKLAEALILHNLKLELRLTGE